MYKRLFFFLAKLFQCFLQGGGSMCKTHFLFYNAVRFFVDGVPLAVQQVAEMTDGKIRQIETTKVDFFLG